MTPKEFLPIIL